MTSDAFCGALAGNLLNYTFYQAPPTVLDSTPCLPLSSTPHRARMGTRLLWPLDLPVHWDVHPPHARTPRSIVAPSTAGTQAVFSPSPLPLSQVPSLVYPEISPPSQGSGSTPFERQFVDDLPREWNSINSQISPIVRGDPHSSVFLSPALSTASGNPFRTATDGPTAQVSQEAVGRVSLIDKFISAAADELAIAEDYPPFSTSPFQGLLSPMSDLSDLTSLSSSESFDHSRPGLESRSKSPPMSPITPGQPKHRRLLKYRREPSPGRSPRSSSPSPSCDPDYRPAKGTKCKRKRPPRGRDGNEIPNRRKRARTTSDPGLASVDADLSLGALTRRFPTDLPRHAQFPLFYLRFPVSSYLRLADGTFVLLIEGRFGGLSGLSNISSRFPLLSTNSKHPAGTYNEPRDVLDLYTPRFVKGCGVTKVGVCPICIEPPSRGGKGETVWLAMKFSAYKWHVFCSSFTLSTHRTYATEWNSFAGKILTSSAFSYHLQYAHGISSVSARPFSPPVAFRTIERSNPAKHERTSLQEGKCHKCKKWILVESIKDMDIKVKELYWWKHAAACHKGSHIEGDDDFFLDDEIYQYAQQQVL